MATKEDPNEGYRLIQARAESSILTIAHDLAESIHKALNSLAATSNIAKGHINLDASPLPKKRAPKS